MGGMEGEGNGEGIELGQDYDRHVQLINHYLDIRQLLSPPIPPPLSLPPFPSPPYSGRPQFDSQDSQLWSQL